MALTIGPSWTFYLLIFGRPCNRGIVGFLGMRFLTVFSSNCNLFCKIFIVVDILFLGSFLSLLEPSIRSSEIPQLVSDSLDTMDDSNVL